MKIYMNPNQDITPTQPRDCSSVMFTTKHRPSGLTREVQGRCFNLRFFCPSDKISEGRGTEFGSRHPISFVSPPLSSNYEGAHNELYKSEEGRKNQSRPSLQYMREKPEHAVPHRTDFPTVSPNLSKLPRLTQNLLSVRGRQNKPGRTTRRTTRPDFQPALTRCQIARSTNKKTTYKNSAGKFTKYRKIQKSTKVLSYIDICMHNGTHNRYNKDYVNYAINTLQKPQKKKFGGKP